MINLPMRIIVMFDLPTLIDNDKKTYTKYRKNLIKLGYYMLQFSIYVKVAKNQLDVDNKVKIINQLKPDEGSIRVLVITDLQYQKMIISLGEEKNWEKVLDDKNLVLFF